MKQGKTLLETQVELQSKAYFKALQKLHRATDELEAAGSMFAPFDIDSTDVRGLTVETLVSLRSELQMLRETACAWLTEARDELRGAGSHLPQSFDLSKLSNEEQELVVDLLSKANIHV